MFPAEFAYHRPASVDEAIRLLEKHGSDAKLLAGGHSLLPAMKLRLSRPADLIDIGHLPALKYIKDESSHLAIGAAATHWMLESSDLVKEKAPLLAQAAALIGDVQVRNMGTVGGSLAHADPAADYPAAILAAEAQIRVKGPAGERQIAAAEFFVDLYLTSLQPEEIILEVRVPALPKNAGACYLKFPHPASRFAVVGCAATVTVDQGKCKEARVAFTGVASVAFRDRAVEEALRGKALDAGNIEAAAAKAAGGVELLSDIFAGEEYRRHLARVYAGRAITRAAAAAR